MRKPIFVVSERNRSDPKRAVQPQRWLEAEMSDLSRKKELYYTCSGKETMALILPYVFTITNRRFSHDAALIYTELKMRRSLITMNWCFKGQLKRKDAFYLSTGNMTSPKSENC